MNTTGITLYKINGETYCKMIDVIKLIHHEYYETEDKKVKELLDRMEMRVAKNDLLLKDAIKPTVIETKMPCRYAVGYYDYKGKYHFYVGTKDGKAIYSTNEKEALRFKTYRDASACADFVEEDANVLDMEGTMTEEERWQRELNMPFPYDADDGNETAIPVEVVT